MRLVIYILAAVASILLQTAFLGAWRPFGIIPNVLLLAVVAGGLYGSAGATATLAVVGGFWLDISSGSDFGLRTAFYVVMALAVAVVRQLGFHAQSLWMMLLGIVIGTLGYNFAVLASFSFDQIAAAYGVVASKIAIELACNLLLGLLAFIVIHLAEGLRNPRHRIKRAAYL